MPAIRFDNAAPSRFCMFLNHAPNLTNQHARFYNFDGLLKALAGCLHNANGIAVSECFGADVVGFVEVAVEAAMVEGDVEVKDVAVEEETLVGDAVADDFVGGGADGFGEVDIV